MTAYPVRVWNDYPECPLCGGFLEADLRAKSYTCIMCSREWIIRRSRDEDQSLVMIERTALPELEPLRLKRESEIASKTRYPKDSDEAM